MIWQTGRASWFENVWQGFKQTSTYDILPFEVFEENMSIVEYSIMIILVYSFLKGTLSSHVKLSVSKVTNPSGSVHRDAEPSSPCLGSQPGQSIRGLELLSRRWSRGVVHESHVSDGFLNPWQVMPHIQQAATAAPWCKGLERNHINRSSRQWWKRGTDSQTASL